MLPWLSYLKWTLDKLKILKFSLIRRFFYFYGCWVTKLSLLLFPQSFIDSLLFLKLISQVLTLNFKFVNNVDGLFVLLTQFDKHIILLTHHNHFWWPFFKLFFEKKVCFCKLVFSKLNVFLQWRIFLLHWGDKLFLFMIFICFDFELIDFTQQSRVIDLKFIDDIFGLGELSRLALQ